MPPLHFALLVTSVLIAAAATVWLFQLGGIAPGVALPLFICAALAFRVLRR